MMPAHTPLTLSLDPAPQTQLARDSFQHAKQQRAAGAAERPLLLTNCHLVRPLKGTEEKVVDVIIEKGRIQLVERSELIQSSRSEVIRSRVVDAVTIDCRGAFLMPGEGLLRDHGS